MNYLTGLRRILKITSNDNIPNANITFLELAQFNKGNQNRGAAFGSWDVFPAIIKSATQRCKG